MRKLLTIALLVLFGLAVTVGLTWRAIRNLPSADDTTEGESQ